jgi:hypothetical protein
LRSFAVFVCDFFLPACIAQNELQHQLAYRLCKDDGYIKNIVSHGLLSETPWVPFIAAYNEARQAASSGFSQLDFEEALDLVVRMRNGYWSFCGRLTNLAPTVDGILRDPNIKGQWDTWVSKQNALLDRFDQHGRDYKFPGLYHPQAIGLGVRQNGERYAFS